MRVTTECGQSSPLSLCQNSIMVVIWLSSAIIIKEFPQDILAEERQTEAERGREKRTLLHHSACSKHRKQHGISSPPVIPTHGCTQSVFMTLQIGSHKILISPNPWQCVYTWSCVVKQLDKKDLSVSFYYLH